MSYSDSLRQQAKWVRETLDPSTPETQRITLDDVDVEELDAAAAEIDRLRSICNGTVWEENERLQAQLASASERVAEMQAEAGMYHSLYDVATERLASARKALEEIEKRDRMWTAFPGPHEILDRTDYGNFQIRGECGMIAHSALTDENGK